MRNGDTQIIIAGITPGDRLATGDLNELKDGARIKIAD
jgi:hypothetical protein